MGCCPSHPYNDPATLPYHSAAKLTADGSLPPLPPHDDVKETVKEVLTETRPLPSKSTVFEPNNLVKDRSFRQPNLLASNNSKSRIPLTLPLPPDDTSEDCASEICSRSESLVSNAEDSSSSGALLRTVASKSEGRRSNSSRSPAKRPPSRTQSPDSAATFSSARKNVRRTQEHSPGHGRVARESGGPKEDLGERSARRSRSLVTSVGRTEPGRRADPNPGRLRRLNGSKREELIENPLVSLECFIFL